MMGKAFICYCSPAGTTRQVATVIIGAHDDAGTLKAFNRFNLQPGGKIVDTAKKLFALENPDFDPVKMAEATLMVFISDHQIIGFQPRFPLIVTRKMK